MAKSSKLVYSTDSVYVDMKNGVRLIWSAAYHWRSYTRAGGDFVESLSGDDVREWLKESGCEWEVED